MTTTTIVYHNIKPGLFCPDGIAAAWVASKAFIDPDFLGYCYQRINNNDQPSIVIYDDASEDFVQQYKDKGFNVYLMPKIESERIVIVDFSFPVPVFEEWQSQGKKVIVLDHHEGAVDMLMGRIDLLSQIKLNYDLSECGATLTWKHFFPSKPMPTFLRYVKDRDLWNKELPYTEEAHSAMGALSRKGFQWAFALFDYLSTLSEDEFIAWAIENGSELAENRKAKVQGIITRQKPTLVDVLGYTVPLIKLKKSHEPYTSDIGNQLCLSFPESPFSLLQMSDGTKYSLRAVKGAFSVLPVAQSFGGSGHPSAAGFTSGDLPYVELNNEILTGTD